MATTPFQADSNPLPSSPSLSSISKPSKGLLSFTKSRKSSSSKLRSKTSLSALDEATPQQPARPAQGNVRRAVIRDSIAIRDTSHSGQRNIIRKRASIRPTDASVQNGAPIPEQTSPLFLRQKESEQPVASGASMLNGGSKERVPRAAARNGIMRRITRRLHTPRHSHDSSAGELPIQRVPSLHRKSSRLSHRSSRVRSLRNSNYRPLSTRLSRASSGLGYCTTSRPPSGNIDSGRDTPVRPPSAVLQSIGSSFGQDADSNYSTESEADDAPITMRSAKYQRDRAATVTASITVVAIVNAEPPSRVAPTPVRTPLADLIEEIAEEIEGRPSQDTLGSAWDFSLDHYCNAFPAPPSPGVLSGGLFPSTEKIHKENNFLAPNEESYPFSRPITSPSSSASLGVPKHPDEPLMRQGGPDVFSNGSDVFSNWNFPDISSPLKLGTRASVSSASKSGSSERDSVANSSDGRQTPSRVVHKHRKSSTSTAASSAPVTPATPSFVRTRSVDPLAQARRKTRIVSGHVIDSVNDDVFTSNDPMNQDLRDGAGGNNPLWWGSSAALTGSQPTLDRRPSDKSSVFSLVTPDQMDPPTAPFDNSYSLNSPHEEEAEIGIALTTESRQLASPSPVQEREFARLTLFARRKGLRRNESISKSHLRLEPAPPMPPLPENMPSSPPNQSYPNQYGPAAAVPSHHLRNQSLASRTFAPSPPPSAPAKRKSFFRYPFSSRRSNSSNKIPNIATLRTASPPLPSPGAVAPPMSATARNPSFPFLNHAATLPYSSSSSSILQDSRKSSSRPTTPSKSPSKFPSFSRPSSSRGKLI